MLVCKDSNWIRRIFWRNSKGNDRVSTTFPPDERYTLRFYRSSGGATTGFAMLGIMKDQKTKEQRRIYWEYPCREVSVKWRRDVVIINDTRLNI
ncbi:DUF5412 family protein [Exiguobacterium sp. Helios]|uniref:DUF5412 family protein n=1 Tax=Exiguobacterium sp. Helios TaxID=2735868 RepID=UPI00210367B1|nr:DUF5412 family protein [Exiguobacterium sp. Helios]